VFGMRDGTFTGRKLARYINGKTVDFYNARWVVNGRNREQKIVAERIADYARK